MIKHGDDASPQALRPGVKKKKKGKKAKDKTGPDEPENQEDENKENNHPSQEENRTTAAANENRDQEGIPDAAAITKKATKGKRKQTAAAAGVSGALPPKRMRKADRCGECKPCLHLNWNKKCTSPLGGL